MPTGKGNPEPSVRIVGRYALYSEIASGGMATVHFGRLLGPVGFSRTVAIKRLHPQFAKDPEAVSMAFDEARLVARIRHRNVVAMLDVVALSGELLLVMEYIHGESLSRLLKVMKKAGETVDPAFAVAIACDTLLGLHAAHTARSEQGLPLGIVHRDVSPQNILLGVDGTARVVDFGIAKAADRTQVTRDGIIKGKLAYMAPEQIVASKVDHRADVFSTSLVLWEMLAGRRLRQAREPVRVMADIMRGEHPPPPSSVNPAAPRALDALVLRGLEHDPAARFATAREMALALEAAHPAASSTRISSWVETHASTVLAARARELESLESCLPAGAHACESNENSNSDMDRASLLGLSRLSVSSESDLNSSSMSAEVHFADTSSPASLSATSAEEDVSEFVSEREILRRAKKRRFVLGSAAAGTLVVVVLLFLTVLNGSRTGNYGSAEPVISTTPQPEARVVPALASASASPAASTAAAVASAVAVDAGADSAAAEGGAARSAPRPAKVVSPPKGPPHRQFPEDNNKKPASGNFGDLSRF